MWDVAANAGKYALKYKKGRDGKEVLIEGKRGWEEYWVFGSQLKSVREVMRDGDNGGGFVGYERQEEA